MLHESIFFFFFKIDVKIEKNGKCLKKHYKQKNITISISFMNKYNTTILK